MPDFDPMKYSEEETAAAKEITDKRWADRLVPDIEDRDIVEKLESSVGKGNADVKY